MRFTFCLIAFVVDKQKNYDQWVKNENYRLRVVAKTQKLFVNPKLVLLLEKIIKFNNLAPYISQLSMKNQRTKRKYREFVKFLQECFKLNAMARDLLGDIYGQEYFNFGNDDDYDEKTFQQYCVRLLKMVNEFNQSSQSNSEQGSIQIQIDAPASELKTQNTPKPEVVNTQEYVSFFRFKGGP